MFRIQSTHFVVVVAVAVAALLAVSKSVDGFATPTTPQQKSQLSMAQNHQDGQQDVSRRVAMMGMTSVVAAATVFLSPFNTVALALEEDVAADVATDAAANVAEDTTTTTTTVVEAVVEAPKYSISKCSVSPKSPVCISTSNVRQLDLYEPPWTFASNADEAMARLKGAVEGEPLNSIVPSEDNTSRHLLVDSKRSKLGQTAYRMEFIINEADGVITFRSSAQEDITGPDFGLQRRRLAEIRERAGSFGMMGEGLNSADSKTTGEKGYGPLGQLKSFYGLQSGGGYEDVLK